MWCSAAQGKLKLVEARWEQPSPCGTFREGVLSAARAPEPLNPSVGIPRPITTLTHGTHPQIYVEPSTNPTRKAAIERKTEKRKDKPTTSSLS